MDRQGLLEWGKSRHQKGLSLYPTIIGGRKKKQAKELFGGWREFIIELGLEHVVYGKDYKPTILETPASWTKDKLIQWVQDEYKKGKPLNYNYLDRKNNHMMSIIRRFFPSHKACIIEAGLDYSEIKGGNHTFNPKDNKNILVSINTGQLGYTFEELLGELFKDLGKEFSKYSSNCPNCEPDFIFSKRHWADAKLSVNTDTRRMRKKYLQYCRRLTVFHLIGSHDYAGILEDGTERYSIFAYLSEQDQEIQNKYLSLFLQLEKEYQKAVA